MNRDRNLVMISVGADDGVRRGYRFRVYRGGNLVATVEVEKVLADMSAARKMGGVASNPGRPKAGDDVETSVY